jgi:hypothetical protein
LLSNREYDIKSIVSLFQTRNNTIEGWFSNWTIQDIIGLQIVDSSGRKSDLSTASDD